MMKKLVCILVLLLAAGANAGTIIGVSTGTATPDTMGGYFFDDPKLGNETRNVLWTPEPESNWDGGHRDVGQTFILGTAQALKGFAFRMDPRGGEYAAYMPSAGREMMVSLYQMGASNYDMSQGTLLTSWTGTVTNTMVNGSAAESWATFNFGELYALSAGLSYGIKLGMTSKSGSDKWGGFIGYGLFDPEGFSAEWGVYTGGAAQTYYKTWRDGRFALITPEPATLALLGIGGLLLRRRSK